MLRDAYRENVDIAVEAVVKIAAAMEDRTVVSADHGELLSERYWPNPYRRFGHPPAKYVPELVRVPWFVVSGERRAIASGLSTGYQSERRIEAESKETLAALGYLDGYA